MRDLEVADYDNLKFTPPPSHIPLQRSAEIMEAGREVIHLRYILTIKGNSAWHTTSELFENVGYEFVFQAMAPNVSNYSITSCFQVG